MSNKPHFIVIGAMKCATSTLQEQLLNQPGIFMSTPKEPNFFSDDDQYAKGIDWYTDLFASASDGDLLGEASTHYTKLPTYPDVLKRMSDYFDDMRFVYVMRHPVDRLISHFIHEWTMGKINKNIDSAIKEHSELISYGQYSMQLKPYFETFGHDSVLPVFFDRLTSEPQLELERICNHIGYQGKPVWVFNQQPSNVSNKRVRKFPLYHVLVESSWATMLRRSLVPRGWRNKIKNQLTMSKRPVISSDVQNELVEIFDRDISILGKWLGVDMDCNNFRSITAERPLSWVLPDD